MLYKIVSYLVSAFYEEGLSCSFFSGSTRVLYLEAIVNK